MRNNISNHDYQYWNYYLNMFRKLFIINLVILCLMVSIGCIGSCIFGEKAPLPLNDSSLRVEDPMGDFIFILKNNLFLVSQLLLGSITFGVLSIILFGWNGFLLGMGLPTIVNLNGLVYISGYIYIFFEFLSLTFAVTAGEKIGIDFFIYFSETRKPRDLYGMFLLVILSIGFMVIAGIIETYYLYKL